jgi:hypothetical protein
MARGCLIMPSLARNNFTFSKKDRNPLSLRYSGLEKIRDARVLYCVKLPRFNISDVEFAQNKTGRTRWHGPLFSNVEILGSGRSTGTIVPVDPNSVMTAPMSRNPAPISSASPVPRSVSVIRLIAKFDADTNRINGRRKSAHAKQSCKKQSNFFHKNLFCIF